MDGKVYSHMELTENRPISIHSIEEAAKRIKPYIHHPPILTCEKINKIVGRNLYFKCENLQKTGSFKYRGASNAILLLKQHYQHDDFVAVTLSSGNMGQALSLAASKHNVKSIVIVPKNTPDVKKQAIKGYGATIVECESNPQAAAEMIQSILKSLNGKGEYISCGDHPFIMEGQGTVALEMLKEIPHLDAIVVCTGTGSMLSGVSVAAKSIKPDILVYGAEPKQANNVEQSFQQNCRVVFDEYPETIAEGLRMSVGKNTWRVIQEHADGSISATDKEISNAMFLLWERMKLIVEPSGAMATAAVLTEKFKSFPKHLNHIGVTISGGNLDLKKHLWKGT